MEVHQEYCVIVEYLLSQKKKNYKIDILLVMFYCRISNKKILSRIVTLNYNQVCNYIGIYFLMDKV